MQLAMQANKGVTMIRKDIFSVKVYDNSINSWCHTRMFKNKSDALKYLRGEKFVNPFVQIKIVHPAQWVVDGFIAAGNRID